MMHTPAQWRDGIDNWPRPVVDAALELEESAFVMVDMQKYFVDADGPEAARLRKDFPDIHDYFFKRLSGTVVPSLAAVLARFRASNLPVIHVMVGPARSDGRDLPARLQRRYTHEGAGAESLDLLRVGQPWHDVIDELKPQPDELIVRKTSWSPFSCTGIDQLLRNLRVQQLVVGGFATNGCVELTARDAADRGYETFLLEDGCVTFTEASHIPVLRTFQQIYGRVLQANDVMDAFSSGHGASATRASATEQYG